jgi:hypothetical protein
MLADVLAIIAVVLSAGSLGAQVGSFVLSGAVVRVTGSLSYAGTFTLPGEDEKEEQLSKRITVTAANKGRSPVTVNSIGFGSRRGFRLISQIYVQPERSQSIPFRLEPGSDATWEILREFVDNMESILSGRKARAVILLADGRTLSLDPPPKF